MFDDIIKKIIEHEGDNLKGISLVGSRGRGDYDDYSDYDLVCICKNIDNPLYYEGMHSIDNQIYGFRIIPIDYLIKKRFKQIEKHAYVNSKIIYDQDNTINSLIFKKCIWEENERLNLFCDYLVKLSYAYNVTNNYKKCWNGCNELKKSINRNRKVHTIIKTFDLLRYSIYLELLNKKIFIPPDKVLLSEWALSKSSRIKEIYENFITYSIKNPIQFAKKITPIVSKTITEFESQVKLPENIYKYRIGVTRKYE